MRGHCKPKSMKAIDEDGGRWIRSCIQETSSNSWHLVIPVGRIHKLTSITNGVQNGMQHGTRPNLHKPKEYCRIHSWLPHVKGGWRQPTELRPNLMPQRSAGNSEEPTSPGHSAESSHLEVVRGIASSKFGLERLQFGNPILDRTITSIVLDWQSKGSQAGPGLSRRTPCKSLGSIDLQVHFGGEAQKKIQLLDSYCGRGGDQLKVIHIGEHTQSRLLVLQPAAHAFSQQQHAVARQPATFSQTSRRTKARAIAITNFEVATHGGKSAGPGCDKWKRCTSIKS